MVHSVQRKRGDLHGAGSQLVLFQYVSLVYNYLPRVATLR